MAIEHGRDGQPASVQLALEAVYAADEVEDAELSDEEAVRDSARKDGASRRGDERTYQDGNRSIPTGSGATKRSSSLKVFQSISGKMPAALTSLRFTQHS